MHSALSNAHTHTTHCDGKDSPETVARVAYERGFVSLGFSSHAPQAFDRKYSVRDEAAYIADIARLKREYRGRMRIWLGSETDAYSAPTSGTYDYVIGAAHYIRVDGEQYTIDGSPERLDRYVRERFAGDGVELARRYYETLVGCARMHRPDIIAHFDLIRKYNADGRLFRPDDGRYRRIALASMENVRKYSKIIEINTGAMTRGYMETPYPESFLLDAWREMGGEIIINSDSHRADYLSNHYESAVLYAKRAGYATAYRLGSGYALFDRYVI